MRRGHKSIQNIRLIRLIIRQALLGAPSFANANICKTILDLAHILLKHACTHLQLMVGIHAHRVHTMFAPGGDQNINVRQAFWQNEFCVSFGNKKCQKIETQQKRVPCRRQKH